MWRTKKWQKKLGKKTITVPELGKWYNNIEKSYWIKRKENNIYNMKWA